jgi:hypothetical protein
MSLEYLLSSLLPVLLIAVISEVSNSYNFLSSRERVSNVVGRWSECHDPVIHSRQVNVIVCIPVETSAVDCNIKSDNAAPLISQLPVRPDRRSGCR